MEQRPQTERGPQFETFDNAVINTIPDEEGNTLEYVVKLSDQELESALRNIDQNCLQFDAMDDERRQKAKVDIERLISKLKDPEIKRRIFEASKEISKLQSDVIELIK